MATKHLTMIPMKYLLMCNFVSAMTLELQNPSDQTCTYTFNVPRDGASCLGSHQEIRDSIETLVSNQHVLLEQQLNVIIEKLVQMEQRWDSIKENEDENVETAGAGGTTYVRWGRTSCPETASVIYQGYMGKSHYDQGGGVNYLCLPDSPEHPVGASSGHQSGSNIYGAEYQHENNPLYSNTHHDNDVPCVVCDVIGRSRALMIPAKMTCPEGWVKEYQGLLMSQHSTQKGSDFVCVSDGMEHIPGGAANQNGGLLYVVEASCGSLKCPPYVDGFELTCVVCTK